MPGSAGGPLLKLLRGSYSVSLLRPPCPTASICFRCAAPPRGLMDQGGPGAAVRRGPLSAHRGMRAVLWQTLDTVGAAIERQGRFSRAVLNAVYYIRIHCAEDLSCPISRLCRGKLTTSAAFFRENTGFSVRDFITMVRIEKSKALLRRRTVAEAAEAVGFTTQKYFTRVFKNTPASVRPGTGRRRADNH